MTTETRTAEISSRYAREERVTIHPDGKATY
jgi:hypothetical protein